MLSGYIAILTVFYFSVISFTVSVQRAKRKAKNVLFDIRDLGSEFPHFNAIPFFVLGLPLDFCKFHDMVNVLMTIRFPCLGIFPGIRPF